MVFYLPIISLEAFYSRTINFIVFLDLTDLLSSLKIFTSYRMLWKEFVTESV